MHASSDMFNDVNYNFSDPKNLITDISGLVEWER